MFAVPVAFDVPEPHGVADHRNLAESTPAAAGTPSNSFNLSKDQCSVLCYRIVAPPLAEPRPEEAVPQSFPASPYSFSCRSRNALLITETELNVMAALAIMGLSNRPKNG